MLIIVHIWRAHVVGEGPVELKPPCHCHHYGAVGVVPPLAELYHWLGLIHILQPHEIDYHK